ncbi:MAG: Cys-tRNA(Pro) deacylase [Pygmaiobacter massiliensis]|nr:Cys-tRNA(Pro) deacylase [Pygmaiobacter massiliensis]
MAKKEQKTNVMRLLEKEKVAYIAHEYPHEDGVIDGVGVAAKLGQPVECVFKTLVTRSARGGFFVFCIPVAKELDLKKAARAVGEKSISMIHVAEINQVTGYIRGGCSPLGMKKKYPTVLDQSAQEREHIMVSAGKIGFQVELCPKQLARLAGATFAPLTQDE